MTPTPPRDVLVQVVAEMRAAWEAADDNDMNLKNWADRIERALAVQGEGERCPICETGTLWARESCGCTNCEAYIVKPDQSRRNKISFDAAIAQEKPR